MKIFKLLLLLTTGLLRWILLLSVTLLYYFAVQSEVYTFPAPQPFSGDKFFNPYAQLPGQQSPSWVKANFHAHSKAYGGTTNGEQSTEAVIEAYRKMGYKVAAVSDYFKPHPSGKKDSLLIISAYEHGLNIFKTHRNVIGTEEPVLFDIPLNLIRSNKQYVLKLLREKAQVLAVNHPKFMDGHTVEDVKYLSGYDNLEVLNHFRNSSVYWDSALSAGRPVMLISNDDTHNINNPDETGTNLTLLNVASLTPGGVYTALQSGAAIGVVTRGAAVRDLFRSLSTENNTLHLQLSAPADSILLIGQWGKIQAKEVNTASFNYSIRKDDSYLRAVVYHEGREYYFNPVIRYSGSASPVNTAAYSLNGVMTAFYRIILTVVWGCTGVMLFYAGRKQKSGNSTQKKSE